MTDDIQALKIQAGNLIIDYIKTNEQINEGLRVR